MTITIQPLEGLTDSQTLEIMQMWVNGDKMTACRRYNYYSHEDNRATFGAYEKLEQYFSKI